MKRLIFALALLIGYAVPASAQMNCVIQNGTTYCGNGVVFTTPVFVTSQGFTSAAGTAADTFLVREGDNILGQKDGSSVQTFHVAGGASDAVPTVNTMAHLFIGNSSIAGQSGVGGEYAFGWNAYYNSGWKYRLADTAAKIGYNTVASGCWSIQTAGSGSADAAITFAEHLRVCTAGTTAKTAFFLAQPAITVGSGTGVTVNNTGEARDPVYKVTIDKSAFVCNATTCDVTVGTLPANTRLLQVDASLTTTFACTATCTTSTLSMVLGKGSGGSEYLASFDADAATAWLGDADAELGTLMVRAAAINGGTFTTGSQAVVLRLTSGTGAVGTGSATNLSQGSVTIFLHTLTMP